MFDYNMMLLDGSVDHDPDTDTAATSTTRDADTGAAVVDLGVGGTPASGLSVVLILPEASADADILTARLEVSDEEDFSDDVHVLDMFEIDAAVEGQILGSETPAVVIRRFSTKKRYVRYAGTVTAGDDFKAVKCYLTPFPFYIL